MKNLKELYEEYKIDNDIFSEEEETTKKLKEIIWNDLNEIDRIIILCYAELASLQKLGNEFRVSRSAIHQRIKQIKGKIKEKLNDTNDNNQPHTHN